MSRSSRLKNILNRRKDLWNDSESDFDHRKSPETSSDENDDLSCCLICSILPNLSNVNTCRKHLNLLTKSIKSTQVVYMMHPAINNCHCRSKSKHQRYRSSSSSSSSESGHHRKKRSMTVLSSDTDSEVDLFFSPTVQSQEDLSYRSNIQARLSPSLPPSTTINTSINYNDVLLTSYLQRNNSSDVIEMDSGQSSNLSLHSIVHVKDENEIINDSNPKQTMINMAEATEQMLNQEFPQPVILLKRICIEN